MTDKRYLQILLNVSRDNILSFEEKVMLGTDSNKIVLAIEDALLCNNEALSCLAFHLTTAEQRYHTISPERLSPLIETAKKLSTHVFPDKADDGDIDCYSYDAYARLVASCDSVNCLNRLLACYKLFSVKM